MESKKQQTVPNTTTGDRPSFCSGSERRKQHRAANARADLRLLRGLCLHVLEPIVAKAQAVLRDASLHLAALEQEDYDDEEAREENTADADALAMLPGFFTALPGFFPGFFPPPFAPPSVPP